MITIKDDSKVLLALFSLERWLPDLKPGSKGARLWALIWGWMPFVKEIHLRERINSWRKLHDSLYSHWGSRGEWGWSAEEPSSQWPSAIAWSGGERPYVMVCWHDIASRQIKFLVRISHRQQKIKHLSNGSSRRIRAWVPTASIA